MDIKQVVGHVVKHETGEITADIYEGDRIVRGNSVNSLNKKQSGNSTLVEWNLESFMKTHIPEMKLWIKDLNGQEKIFLFSITPYISYDDCHLQYDNGVDMGSEDIVKITGMARSVVYETISSLIRKDILYKGRNSKNRQYFVNPWLFCKGNRVNKVLQTMFKNYKIRVLGGKKWKDIKDK